MNVYKIASFLQVDAAVVAGAALPPELATKAAQLDSMCTTLLYLLEIILRIPIFDRIQKRI